MLDDLTTAIDASVEHFHGAPRSVLIAGDLEAGPDHEAHLGTQLRNLRKALRLWLAKGAQQRHEMEEMLKTIPLEAGHLQRLLRLSQSLAKRAEQSAGEYAPFVTSIRKQARKAAMISTEGGGFLETYADQIEALLEQEINALTEASDHFRGLARLHDPKRGQSEVFSDAASAIAFLKTA